MYMIMQNEKLWSNLEVRDKIYDVRAHWKGIAANEQAAKLLLRLPKFAGIWRKGKNVRWVLNSGRNVCI